MRKLPNNTLEGTVTHRGAQSFEAAPWPAAQ